MDTQPHQIAPWGINKAVLYLICHDHDLAVAQSLEGFWVTVVLLVLKPEDFNDVVDLSVLHNLMKIK